MAGTRYWDFLKKEQQVLTHILYPAICSAISEDLDGDRISVLMLSLRGCYGVRLALSSPTVDAPINASAPIALNFTKKKAKRVPDVMIAGIAHAMGEKPGIDLGLMVAKVKLFSLDRKPFLGNPQHQVALLSINGDKDPLVPSKTSTSFPNAGFLKRNGYTRVTATGPRKT